MVTIPIGLWLWDGLGPYFGLGERSGQVDQVAAYVMLACLVALVALEITLSTPTVTP